jgi:hypothetical protein
MRPAKNAALLLASAALAAGCFVKVEDQSVAVTKASICPGGTCPPLTSTGGALVIQVDLDLGGADFLQPSTDLGPVTLNNSLNLNQASLAMVTAGTSFAGITLLELVQVPTPTPPGTDCAPAGSRLLATYDKATNPAPDPMVITMAGSGTNLLELTAGTSLVVLRLCAQGGAPPSANWNADLTLDMALAGKATYP